VALTNLEYLSCPSYGVRNALFHSMKTETPVKKKVKLSHYTPWRHMEGEEV
jgi:hypothetical protein